MLEYRPIVDFAGFVMANTAMGLEHQAEIIGDEGIRKYEPDLERYTLMEHAGVLVSVGVYDGETAVGYATAIVTTHTHDMSTVMAISDTIFLRESYRQGRNGIRLIETLREKCKAQGAQLMLWSARTDTTFARLLERRGCAAFETLYSDKL